MVAKKLLSNLLLQYTDGSGHTTILSDRSRCEAWIGDEWRLVNASDVIQRPGSWLLRCAACHGPVHAEKAGSHMKDRFEHNRGAHSGCPLFFRHAGPPSRSPNPVEANHEMKGPAGRDLVDDDLAGIIIGNVPDTDKKMLIRARVGQGKYRDDLMAIWGGCSVIGCGPASVLVASHIIPWCKCRTNTERIDPANGLLLTPNLDKLFDRGLITFETDGRIRISRALLALDAEGLGIHAQLMLRKVPESTKAYLVRHVNEGHFQQ